jgi:hypothetical protein
MGNLFARHVSPLDVEAMSWGQLRYWGHWHTLMAEAEIEGAARAQGH